MGGQRFEAQRDALLRLTLQDCGRQAVSRLATGITAAKNAPLRFSGIVKRTHFVNPVSTKGFAYADAITDRNAAA